MDKTTAFMTELLELCNKYDVKGFGACCQGTAIYGDDIDVDPVALDTYSGLVWYDRLTQEDHRIEVKNG